MNEKIRFDEIKRKIRNLKRQEEKIRFAGSDRHAKDLVWNQFFDLRNTDAGNARYTLKDLASMNKEVYKSVVEEYFAFVYYEVYKTGGIFYLEKQYNPEILTKLNLPLDVSDQEVKKRFRELAKKYHPDTGGNADQFIELMNDYRKLIEN